MFGMFPFVFTCRPPRRSFRGGFSLVEMGVVLTIIGVIVGIAFSYFRQSEGDANDVAAQQIARSTATVLETVYQSRGVWVTDPVQLEALMPDRTFVSGATAAPFDVSVASTGLAVSVAVQSDSGSCVVIKVTDQVTSVVEATDAYTISTQSLCSGAAGLLTPPTADAW